MTTGAAALLGLMLVGLAGAVTPEEIGSIVRGIDTPRDTPIPFVERRANRLLAEPLKVSGDILFTSEGTLSKKIGAPFDESVTISSKRVALQRGEKTRNLSLDRRPDIKAFYTGMQALIAGDVTALFASFDVAATGDANGWILDLAPKEKKLRKFVARLVISGKGGRVLTVRTEQPGGDWQEMAFGVAAD